MSSYLYRCGQVPSLEGFDHAIIVINSALLHVQVNPGGERLHDLCEGDGEDALHLVAGGPGGHWVLGQGQPQQGQQRQQLHQFYYYAEIC